jgi:hypothetical protein
MRSLYRLPLFFVLALFIIGTPSLRAGWLQEDVAVCTSGVDQQSPVVAEDGQGGAFIAWEDSRDPLPFFWYYLPGGRIFVQRYGADGTPLWPMNGIDLSPPGMRSAGPSIVPDGTGGAFVVFLADSAFCTLGYCDGLFSPYEIARRLIVSRIGADGTLLWQKELNCAIPSGWSTLYSERYPMSRSDGTGGVIIIWEIAEGFTPRFSCPEWPQSCHGTWASYHLFAQRIDADGNRLWGASPVRICSDPNAQAVYHSAQTQSGAVIVAWADYRNSSSGKDIYAQRLDLDGSLLWGPAGIPVNSTTGEQDQPFVASDGADGAIVIWNNCCNPYYVQKFGIWAQRLDVSGQPCWPFDGIPIESNCQLDDKTGIIPTFTGGAIIFWTAGHGARLTAQRIDSLGNALWGSSGRLVSESTYGCVRPRAIPDGEGGAVFSWERIPKTSSVTIYGLWGFSSTDIFAVGSSGAIFHYDGTAWSPMSSPTTEILSSVWGSSPDNLFAVGSYGKILHYNGAAWTSMTSGTTNYLYGVWGSAPDTVYAVGKNATVLRFDGSTWINMNYPGTESLYGVHGRSGTDVYAVETYDVVHFDGVAWSTVKSSGGMDCYQSIWVSPEHHIFVGGYTNFTDFSWGFVQHYDGSTWQEQSTDMLYCSAIWGTDSSNVYALYATGNIAHYDGSAWTKSRASAQEGFYTLWGTADGDIWIGGINSCIRHFDDGEWVTQTLSAGRVYMSRIDAAGAALWDEYGAPASIGLDAQTNHYLAPIGDGSALVAWQDGRNSNWDIYARKVSISRGPLVATELMSFNASLLEAGIRVAWQLSQFDEGASFAISRSAGPSAGAPDETWAAITPAISREDLSFSFVDNAIEQGALYRYRVQISDEHGGRTLFETDIVSAPRLPLTLFQNVPNPFNPSTTIRYYLPEKCRVKVAIYDVAGRTIANLEDRDRPPGHYSLAWNGRDNLGKPAASGIYFCRLQAGKEMRSRKMVLLR